jgi:hypothetical protein
VQIGQTVAARRCDGEARDNRNDAVELEGLESARMHG